MEVGRTVASSDVRENHSAEVMTSWKYLAEFSAIASDYGEVSKKKNQVSTAEKTYLTRCSGGCLWGKGRCSSHRRNPGRSSCGSISSSGLLLSGDHPE